MATLQSAMADGGVPAVVRPWGGIRPARRTVDQETRPGGRVILRGMSNGRAPAGSVPPASPIPRQVRVGYGLGSFCTGTFSTVPGLLLLFYLTNVLGVRS